MGFFLQRSERGHHHNGDKDDSDFSLLSSTSTSVLLLFKTVVLVSVSILNFHPPGLDHTWLSEIIFEWIIILSFMTALQGRKQNLNEDKLLPT